MKYRVEVDADGVCGFSTEIEAESMQQAKQIAVKQATYIENWEVLGIHNPPLERDMAVTILTDDDREMDGDDLVQHQLGVKGA